MQSAALRLLWLACLCTAALGPVRRGIAAAEGASASRPNQVTQLSTAEDRSNLFEESQGDEGEIRVCHDTSTRVGDYRYYEFVLHNTSDDECAIKSATVVCSGSPDRRCKLLQLSSHFIKPGGYEYGVCRWEIADEMNTPTLEVEHQGRNGIERVRHTVTTQQRRLDAALFSSDLTSIYVYSEVPANWELNDVALLTLNGKELPIVRASQVPLCNQTSVVCIEAHLSPPLRLGQRVFLCLKSVDGSSRGLACRANPLWMIGKTQYDYPLRVVGVRWREDSAVLKLYNESNSLKNDVIVDSVAIDGIAVTEQCRLPQGVLPADRHEYDGDIREIEIPFSDRYASEATHVAVNYRLIKGRIGTSDSVAGPSRRTIDCFIYKNVDLPAGGFESTYVPKCVCLHNDGLRESIPATVLSDRSHHLAKADPSIVSYIRAFGAHSAKQLYEISRTTDFLVVGYEERQRAFEEVKYIDDGLREISMAGIPFIASVTGRRDYGLTVGDARWLLLSALAEGSKGLLLSSSTHELNSDFPEFFEQLAGANQSLRDLFSLSHVVPVPVRTSHDGLRVRVLMRGADSAVLVIVNEWCNRHTLLAKRPFWVQPRHDVELDVSFGDKWLENGAKAFDVSTNQNCKSKLFRGRGGRRLNVTIDRLSIGKIILVRRNSNEPDAGVSEDGAFSALFTDGPFDHIKHLLREDAVSFPALEPLANPFVELGYMDPNEESVVEIPIRNNTGEARNVVVRPAHDHWQHFPGKWHSEPLILASGQTGALTIRYRRPGSREKSLTTLSICSQADGSLPFGHAFYTTMQSEAVTSYAMNPPILDFGRVTHRRPTGTLRATIWSEDRSTKARIATVNGNSDHISVSIAPDDIYLEASCKAGRVGRFAGELEISLEDTKGCCHKLMLPYRIEVVPTVSVSPEKILVVGETGKSKRTLRLRHLEGHSLEIKSVETSIAALQIGADILYSEPAAIEIYVDHSQIPSSGAKLWIQYTDQRTHTIDKIAVPLRTIPLATDVNRQTALSGTLNAQRKKKQQSDHQHAIDQLKMDVRRTVATFQQIDTQALPDWASFHFMLVRPKQSAAAIADGIDERLMYDCNRVLATAFVPRRGKLHPREDGQLFDRQHHQDQFLHLLSMARIPVDTRIVVGGQSFELRDVVDQSLREVRLDEDISWTASAYSYYLDPNQEWTSKFGERSSMKQVLRTLANQRSVYCGGTHALLAMARVSSHAAYRENTLLQKELQDINRRLSHEVSALRRMQQADGWFRVPAAVEKSMQLPSGGSDMGHIYYSGHSLEWLAIYLSEVELKHSWVIQVVQALLDAVRVWHETHHSGSEVHVYTVQDVFDVGFVTHAVSALVLWLEKMESDSTSIYQNTLSSAPPETQSD